MTKKLAFETVTIENENAINGLQLLEKFQQTISCNCFDLVAEELWKYLIDYLDSDEEYDLFTGWSKIKMNQGSREFHRALSKIKHRMKE